VVAQADAGEAFGRSVETGLAGADAGFALPQVSIVPSNAAPRRVYEPGNPLADAKGYVSYAGVDNAGEMVTMMSAMRSYEANVAAMNMSKTLALKALNIGGAAS
jgi:flagellar basal-body rod protein FlgC